MDRWKILIVDDEEQVVRALKGEFRNEPYEIMTASSGDEALEIMNSRSVDLIITDHRMPGISGIDVCEKANMEKNGCLCILLTGLSDTRIAIEAVNRGVYKFMLKPWDSNILKVTVKRSLEHLKTLREKKEYFDLVKKRNDELTALNQKLETLVSDRTAHLEDALKTIQLLNEELNWRVEELELRDSMLEHMLSVHSREETFHHICESASRFTGSSQVGIFTVSEDKVNEVHMSYVLDTASGSVYMHDSDNESGDEVILPDPVTAEKCLKHDKEVIQESEDPDGTTVYIPLNHHGHRFGILTLWFSSGERIIDENGLKALRGLLQYFTMAIDETELFDSENALDMIDNALNQ